MRCSVTWRCSLNEAESYFWKISAVKFAHYFNLCTFSNGVVTFIRDLFSVFLYLVFKVLKKGGIINNLAVFFTTKALMIADTHERDSLQGKA